MARWTEKQVLDAAPDDRSVTAARRLARPGPWSETGSTETLLWGSCQGSGRTPYQVSIDLTGPAFRCSCPSRKHPCKHGLALLLLWVSGDGSVADVAAASGFAQDWADQRAANAAARTQTRRRPVDPAAQARRLDERLHLMSAGMDDFALWLGDLARAGTAAARHRDYAYWDAAAARLVDAQLPGLADRVRELGSAIHARDDWSEHLLTSAGRWWTAAHAWSSREALDEHAMGDLRAYLGWARSSEEVRAGDSVTDTWLVLGAHRTDDGRLLQQRTWLWGETTHETVQVLDFAVHGAPLPIARLVGSVLEVTVARYPGHAPRRALFAEEPVSSRTSPALPAGETITEALARAASVWEANPWAARVPVLLSGVRATATGLEDAESRLPHTPDVEPWLLLALTGGAPCDLFAELEDGGLRPLSVSTGREVVPL